MKKAFILGLVSCVAFLSGGGAQAQTYSGSRAFDGVHKHEVSGYLLGGANVVSRGFGGEAASYTYHFTDRWSIGAGEQAQFGKSLYCVGLTGTYRLPVSRYNLYFDARILSNVYTRWSMHELAINASAYWEASYFDMRLGLSYLHFLRYGKDTDAYVEPPMLTVGLGVNIRPRSNPWNIGLFIRNYDEYYYEIWNINYGIRFHATLPWQNLKLYGELNNRPAGNLSQLATYYEVSLKLGLKYAF